MASKIRLWEISRTFPTWQEVRELRDTVMNLTFSLIVGTVLLLVVLYWFIEFGRMGKINVPPRQTTDDSLRMAENGKVSLSTSNINGDLSISLQAVDSLSASNSLMNAGDDSEDLKNKSRPKSYARDNPPFASLTFSSISFCLVGIVIVMTIMFEKKSALVLEARWKMSSASNFSSKGTEGSSSCPATSSLMLPSSRVSDHVDPITPCKHEWQESNSACYDEATAVAKTFEDESNMASTSTSSQELADGQKLGEQTSDPVILYPSRHPGIGQYWCSVCSSTLVPSPKAPKYQSSPPSRQGKKKLSPSQSPEENQEPAPPESKAHACRKSLSFDVAVPAEDLPQPLDQKAELGSKSGATDMAELGVSPPQDIILPGESDGNLES